MRKHGIETKTEFNSMIGMRDALTKWKTGSPRVSTVFKICDVFKCTPDWLLTGKTTDPAVGGGDSIENKQAICIDQLGRLEKSIAKMEQNLGIVMQQIAIISTEQLAIGRKMTEQKTQIDHLERSLGELNTAFLETQKKSA